MNVLAPKRWVAWFTLALMLNLSVEARGLVLCVHADGHVSVETESQALACCARGIAHGTIGNATGDGCTDTPALRACCDSTPESFMVMAPSRALFPGEDAERGAAGFLLASRPTWPSPSMAEVALRSVVLLI